MIRRILACVGLGLALTGAARADQYLMMPEITNDRVVLLSATDGSLVNLNFIPDAGGFPYDLTMPKAAIQVGPQIWVADQSEDSIHVFTASLTPAYIKTITGQLDNIRGLNKIGNRVYVTNAGTGNGAPGNAVVIFETNGTRVGSFPTGTSPFDVVAYNGGLMVSDFTNTPAVTLRTYNLDGTGETVFPVSPTVNLPEQMVIANTGPAGETEVWVAVFQSVSGDATAPVGVGRYSSTGAKIARYSLGQNSGGSGLHLLPSGDVLYTDQSRVLRFTPTVPGDPSVPVVPATTTTVTPGNTQYLHPLETTLPAGANLFAAGTAPPNCSVGPGGTMNYSVKLYNGGADPSGVVTLTVTLPPASTATYASATPTPSSVTPTELVFNLPSIAGDFGTADVSISLTAVTSGATATLSSTATIAADTDTTNNSISSSSLIAPSVPATARAKAIFSSIMSLANSNVAGGHFTTFGTPFASPNGLWWAIQADTDLATAQDSITMRSAAPGTPSVLLQEGVTTMGNGAALGIYDLGLSVNDSGVVAFTGDDAAASQDEFVAKTDGTTVTDIAREGQTHAGITLATAASTGNAQIFANGNVAFSSTTNPTTSFSYFTNNGTAITARAGVTVPAGGSGQTIALSSSALVTNTANDGGCLYDSTGTHSIYQANVGTVTTVDQCVVADGTIVIREGTTDIDGAGSYTGTPTSANKVFVMGAGGTWMVRGLNSVATEDWVVRGSGSAIAQVYKVGDPIFTGSSLSWKDNGTTTFFAMAVDVNGHYLIGGFSTEPNLNSDVVLVYDNKAIIARENDPVDLDGNGVFDDGMFILAFGTDEVVFIEGGTAILVTVTLRDADGALCGSNNTSRGEALLRIPVPFGACCAGVVCSTTLQVDCAGDPGNFKGVGTACLPSNPCVAVTQDQCCRGTTCVSVTSGTCTGTLGNSASLVVGSCGPHNQIARCCYADYDHSGTSTIDDLFIYINTWLVASPYTKIDGNTTAAPSIDDLFIFINLWLLGCMP